MSCGLKRANKLPVPAYQNYPRLWLVVLLPGFRSHTVAECFFQHGRTTLSVVATEESGKIMTGPGEGAVGVVSMPHSVSATTHGVEDQGNAMVQIENASVWTVDSIWVKKDDLG